MMTTTHVVQVRNVPTLLIAETETRKAGIIIGHMIHHMQPKKLNHEMLFFNIRIN